MSQTEADCCECKHCDMCHKEGLPILLTRYAVATKGVQRHNTNITYESKAPDLAGKTGFDPFQNSGGPIPLGENAYYTLRKLRPGFVYTYNPKEVSLNRWRCYQVTEANCLLPVPLFLDSDPADYVPADAGKPQKVSPCKPDKNGAFAACITIPTAELPDIETLWIAFSDVRWTQYVLNQYEADTDGCRSKTMRPFDVKEWIKSGAPQKHFEKIDQAEQYVAEYAPEIDARAFEYQKVLIGNIYVEKYAILDFNAVVAQYKLESVLDKATKKPVPAGVQEEPEFILGSQTTVKIVPAAGALNTAFHWLVQVFARARAKNLPNETDNAKIWELARSCTLGRGGKLTTDLRRLHEKAVFVALDDIPGIAMELAILTNTLHTNFVRYTEFARPLVTHNAIDQARTAIFDQAELKWLKIKRDRLDIFTLSAAPNALDAKGGYLYPAMIQGLKSPDEIPKEKPKNVTDGGWKEFNELHMYLDTDQQIKERKESGVWSSEQIQRCDEIRAKRSQDLEVSRNTAWKTYYEHIDAAKRDKFKTEYEAALAPYHAEVLGKPIQAHVKWMAAPGLVEIFRHMYDRYNILCGLILVDTFTKCLDGTQKFEPCAQQYQQWLDADETAIANTPLWIALTFNNTKIQEALGNSVKELKAIKIDRDALQPEFAPWEDVWKNWKDTGTDQYASDSNASVQIKKTVDDWTAKQNNPGEKTDYLALATNPVGHTYEEAKKGLKKGSIESATVTAVESIFDRYFAIHKKYQETILTAITSAVVGEHNTISASSPNGSLLEQLKKWFSGSVNTDDPLQSGIDEFLRERLQAVNDSVENMVNRLFGLVAGPAVNVTDSHTQKGTYSPLLVHSGTLARAPYAILECTGSISDMTEHIMRTMQSEGLDEAGLNPTQRQRLTNAIRLRLVALQANGLDTSATVTSRRCIAIPWIILEKIKKKSASLLNVADAASWHALQRLFGGVERIPLQALEQMRAGNFQEAIQTARTAGSPLSTLKLAERIAKGRTFVGGALKNGTVPALFGILSIAGMKAGLDMIDKAQRYGHGAFEAYTRFMAAVFSFAEVLLKAAEKTINTIPTLMLRFGAWAEGIKQNYGEWAQEKVKSAFFSRWVGRFAGGLATFANGIKAREKFGEDEVLLGILYSVSAFVALISIFLGGIPGLILFLFSIALAFAIEYIEGNPFENWMRKCWFGKHTHKYNSIVEEAEKFAESFNEVEIKVA